MVGSRIMRAVLVLGTAGAVGWWLVGCALDATGLLLTRLTAGPMTLAELPLTVAAAAAWAGTAACLWFLACVLRVARVLARPADRPRTGRAPGTRPATVGMRLAAAALGAQALYATIGCTPSTEPPRTVATASRDVGAARAQAVTSVAPAAPVAPAVPAGWRPAARDRAEQNSGLVTAPPRHAEPSPVAEVTVLRGDTLWQIAARRLGPDASTARIQESWPVWYRHNRAVIGPDPDLLLPGTVLRVPNQF